MPQTGHDLDDRQVYTAAEVAEIMRVTPTHVRNLINRGELIASRLGRCYRIPAEAVHELMKPDASDIAERVAASRAKQGLPTPVADVVALQELAVLLEEGGAGAAQAS